jgi:uncharacterized protein YqjF (DUF2071 family)
MTDPAVCPLEVRRPVMMHAWEQLTFLHWSYPVEHVQRLLPPGLEVEQRDGRAWVGLVPFAMRVWLPGTRSVPWVSQFWETNVRTYARDVTGRSGVWFCSLDASRLPVVAVARASYRLPYFWSRMRLTRQADVLRYECRRRWPDGGPTSRVEVAVGSPFDAADLTELDHFLTARWTLFSAHGVAARPRLRYANAEHPRWPLRRAQVLRCDDELLLAAGLPAPEGEPLAHYSEGVTVRIGPPRRVG